MATKIKYRLKKKVKNFLIFYAFICVVFISSYTFSRYITTTSGNLKLKIAKFNVSVNDVNVTNNDSFDLQLSPTTNTYGNKIVPNSIGYFEIVIDPTDTEVSLEYEFLFDLSNFDNDFNLTKFVINDNEELLLNDNIIQGNILLSSNKKAFSNQDIMNIKVYWEWNKSQDVVNPIINNKNIIVTAVIKQKIN